MDYSRNVRLLGWHSFFIGFSLWAPIAILYFSKISGSYALGLSVFSITMISSAALEVPTGVWSDFIGRRKTLIAGSAAYALSAVFYALGHFYGILVIGAILEGLGRALYSGNNTAMIYESVNKSENKKTLEHFLGKIGAAEQWALAFSALIGGIIASKSFSVVVWLSVIPLVICFGLSLFTIEVPKDKASSNIYAHLKEALVLFKKNKRLQFLGVADIIGYGIGESSFNFRSAFVAMLWPVWAIGAAQLLSNVGAAVSFEMAGKVIKKVRSEVILLAQSVYSRMANIIALLFPGILSPILMSSTSGWYGLGNVAETSLYQREFSDKQRATLGSLTSLGGKIVYGLAATLIGVMADNVGPAKALLLGQVIMLMTTWCYIWLAKNDGRGVKYPGVEGV